MTRFVVISKERIPVPQVFLGSFVNKVATETIGVNISLQKYSLRMELEPIMSACPLLCNDIIAIIRSL